MGDHPHGPFPDPDIREWDIARVKPGHTEAVVTARGEHLDVTNNGPVDVMVGDTTTSLPKHECSMVISKHDGYVLVEHEMCGHWSSDVRIAEVPVRVLGDYAKADAENTLRLAKAYAAMNDATPAELPPRIILVVIFSVLATVAAAFGLVWWFTR